LFLRSHRINLWAKIGTGESNRESVGENVGEIGSEKSFSCNGYIILLQIQF
tara:strand:- start:318 stop:470 length:153 start_codon:yes stop_codon:yes gene_type:complete